MLSRTALARIFSGFAYGLVLSLLLGMVPYILARLGAYPGVGFPMATDTGGVSFVSIAMNNISVLAALAYVPVLLAVISISQRNIVREKGELLNRAISKVYRRIQGMAPLQQDLYLILQSGVFYSFSLGLYIGLHFAYSLSISFLAFLGLVFYFIPHGFLEIGSILVGCSMGLGKFESLREEIRNKRYGRVRTELTSFMTSKKTVSLLCLLAGVLVLAAYIETRYSVEFSRAVLLGLAGQ